MKRGEPLKRGKPLKRVAMAPRAKRLSPRSKAKEEARADELIEREFVFARDGRRCRAAGLWDACFGPPTPHHVLKAAQGGRYHRDNLVTLCAHHNGLIEADADFAAVARAAGLVRLSTDPVAPVGHDGQHPTQEDTDGPDPGAAGRP